MENTNSNVLTIKPTPRCIMEFFLVHVEKPENVSTLSKVILNAVNLEATMDRIRFFPEQLELRRTFPDSSERLEPGNVFIFEVDVVCKNNKLQVLEKDPSKREQFFHFESIFATKVIWIRGSSVHVVDAKLRVYEEYETLMVSKNILIQHEFEKHDDICKSSGIQKLKSAIDCIQSIAVDMPVYQIKTILQNAVQKDLSKKNIQDICHEIILHDEKGYVGNCKSTEYICRSQKTVRKIKDNLVRETLKEIAQKIGSNVCKLILKCIDTNIQTNLDRGFSEVKNDISGKLFGKFEVYITEVFIYTFFQSVYETIYSLWTYVVTFVWSVDVNSKRWRDEIAHEIYEKVCEKREGIMQDSLLHIGPLCTETVEVMGKLSSKLDVYAEMIVPSDQEALVKKWKRRKVIGDRESLMKKYPSILAFAAGTKKGHPVVKIFLDHDDTDAKEHFEKECHRFSEPVLHFEYATKPNDEKSESLKGIHIEQTTHIIDRNKRKEIGNIIKREYQRLLANHSMIVGIGVGLVARNGFAEPCIVLRCLDNLLVPFGEQKPPSLLGGYPVDIREDFVMFGHCSNCPSVNNGCSIGRHSSVQTGSVGFLVKSNNPSSSPKKGFLTAAHVAVECFPELHDDNALLSEHPLYNKTNEIVHPSSNDSNNQNNIIGRVSEAFCGNFGTEKTGIDAALVVLYEQNMTDPSNHFELQIAEEEELTFDGTTYVEKTGRTTGKTIGKLFCENFVVSVQNKFCNGGYYIFNDCYAIVDDGTDFFMLGDSGSGVFVLDKKNNSLKPLGIAFARYYSHTAVCRIRKIVDAFNCSMYHEDEPMDLS